MIVWVITILGLAVRLLFIDKPEGLWNDEYISWLVASQPLTNGFLEHIKWQCHMPLYYIYLKIFMTIFSDSDLVLRITSVLAGTASIPVMYLSGREVNKNTGYFAAILTAMSSFMIYYSQEVRLYALLFLFSALSLLFTLKILKKTNIKNLSGLLISDILILLTHTIGFIYVFFNLLLVSIFLYKNFKKAIVVLWSATGASILLSVPLILKIFTTKSFSQWWGSFTPAKFGFLMTDYFSPVLTNLVDSPAKFFYSHSPEFLICALIPAFIAVIWIIKAVIKNRINQALLTVSISLILVMAAAALTGKLVFITKYSIEIYPVLIFLAACGAMSFKKKIWKYSLIIIFCLIHIVYLAASPISAPKIRRAQGHAIVAELIKQSGLKKGDIILLEYYPQSRFEKYFDFSDYRVISIDKGNFPEYMSPDANYSKALNDGKNIYREVFASNINPYLKYKIYTDIINTMQKDQSVLVVMLNSVAFYPSNVMMTIAADDKLYDKTPLLFLVFSHIKTQIFYDLSESLARINFRSKGEWAAIKFTKLNN